MLQQLSRRFGADSGQGMDALSRLVAERSLADVYERLQESVHGMGLSEARGYVRARAHRAVRRHAGIVAAEQGTLDADAEAMLCTRAVEHAVHLVVRELIAVPRAEFGSRRAG